jgi:hypothetical protein
MRGPCEGSFVYTCNACGRNCTNANLKAH